MECREHYKSLIFYCRKCRAHVCDICHIEKQLAHYPYVYTGRKSRP